VGLFEMRERRSGGESLYRSRGRIMMLEENPTGSHLRRGRAARFGLHSLQVQTGLVKE
jgi:hypothetical protein